MNEELLENYLERTAITTLQSMQIYFKRQGLSDKEATLAMAFYINKFVQHGYIGHKPIDILRNVSEIIENVGGNFALDLEHKKKQEGGLQASPHR